MGTTGEDGYNVDCFVLTADLIPTGTIVECESIGLMEQIEDGQADHNVLAVPQGQMARVDAAVRKRLAEFVEHVFEHIDEQQIRTGRFLGPEAALAHIAKHRDETRGAPDLTE